MRGLRDDLLPKQIERLVLGGRAPPPLVHAALLLAGDDLLQSHVPSARRERHIGARHVKARHLAVEAGLARGLILGVEQGGGGGLDVRAQAFAAADCVSMA